MATKNPELHEEPYTLQVTRYKADGLPTCACGWNTGQVCVFLRSSEFGSVEKCAWTLERLNRRKNGVGFIIPGANCPMWPNE